MKTLSILVILMGIISLGYANEENCETLGITLYEDLGCIPVIPEGRKCPTHYKCNLQVHNESCIFRGRYLQKGESLGDETADACEIGCFCNAGNHFTCAILDCPSVFRPYRPDCYDTYTIGKCCPTGRVCSENAPKNPHICEVEGKKYLEGQRFHPKNSCLLCVCSQEYTGKNEAPVCRRRTCVAQVRKSEEISQYCAPVYSHNDEDTALCCPTGWVCPSKNDKTLPNNPQANTNSGLTCKYGDKIMKLGERLEGTYRWFNGKYYAASCECVLPPLLTCKEILGRTSVEAE